LCEAWGEAGEATYVDYVERSIREDRGEEEEEEEEVLDNSFYIHKECQIILESTTVDSKPGGEGGGAQPLLS